jgi:N-acetylneuraminic acid mutarotase
MKPLALAAALALTPLTPAAAPAAWERLAPLPVGNGGGIVAAIADDIVVAGGTTWQGDTKLWLDQIWTYDSRRNAWRETGRLPAPVGYPVTGHDGGPVWFAGGSSGPATHRALWQLTPTGARLAARLERGFVIACGALLGSTLYAVGGTDDQARTDRTTNACLAIDVRTGAITRLADYPEAGLITGTAAAAAGRLFVFGGGRWDPEGKKVVNHATAHAYAPAEKRWEALPLLPHPGRGYSAVALDDRHILLAGGYRNDQVGFVADAYLFDVITRTYAPTTPLPYAAMVHLVRSGDWLYCLGGEDRMKHRTDSVYRIEWAHLLAASRR